MHTTSDTGQLRTASVEHNGAAGHLLHSSWGLYVHVPTLQSLCSTCNVAWLQTSVRSMSHVWLPCCSAPARPGDLQHLLRQQTLGAAPVLQRHAAQHNALRVCGGTCTHPTVDPPCESCILTLLPKQRLQSGCTNTACSKGLKHSPTGVWVQVADAAEIAQHSSTQCNSGLALSQNGPAGPSACATCRLTPCGNNPVHSPATTSRCPARDNPWQHSPGAML